MNWIEEAAIKLKKKNQVLFAKNSDYLQDLNILFQSQNHRVLTLWAFDFAAESIKRLEEKYPQEHRPKEALVSAQDWAAGNVKMRFAQRKILNCHAFAKEINNKEDIAACHAVGHACPVVHTAKHAIGYQIYDLTSIIYRMGIENCVKAVEKRKQDYIDRLYYLIENQDDYKHEWAPFMKK